MIFSNFETEKVVEEPSSEFPPVYQPDQAVSEMDHYFGHVTCLLVAFLTLDFAAKRRQKLVASTINTHRNSSHVILYLLWATHSFVMMEWLIFNTMLFIHLNLNSFFHLIQCLYSIPGQHKFSTASHFTNLVEVLKVFIQSTFNFSYVMDYSNSLIFSIMCN